MEEFSYQSAHGIPSSEAEGMMMQMFELDNSKEYKLERTLWEKTCKRMFNLIYRFYRPKLGNRRMRVNKPFKVVYANGELSKSEYIYMQGLSDNPFVIGLFRGQANGRWYRREVCDDWLYKGRRHLPVVYVDG